MYQLFIVGFYGSFRSLLVYFLLEIDASRAVFNPEKKADGNGTDWMEDGTGRDGTGRVGKMKQTNQWLVLVLLCIATSGTDRLPVVMSQHERLCVVDSRGNF